MGCDFLPKCDSKTDVSSEEFQFRVSDEPLSLWLSPTARLPFSLFPLIPSYEGGQGEGQRKPEIPDPSPTHGRRSIPPLLLHADYMTGFLKLSREVFESLLDATVLIA